MLAVDCAVDVPLYGSVFATLKRQRIASAIGRYECLEIIVSLGFGAIELEVVFAMSHLLLRYGRGQHHDILH